MTRVTQAGNDHSLLIQAINVDCEAMVTSYTATLPAPVVIDLSAVEAEVKRAMEIPQSAPLPLLETVKVEIVDNGKKGAEARSCEVLTVNGVYVPFPDGPRVQPISRKIGCMTGRLYVLARDAGVSIENAEKFAEYMYTVNPHIRAAVDGAFHAIVDAARTFLKPQAMAQAAEAENLKQMAGFTSNKE